MNPDLSQLILLQLLIHAFHSPAGKESLTWIYHYSML